MFSFYFLTEYRLQIGALTWTINLSRVYSIFWRYKFYLKMWTSGLPLKMTRCTNTDAIAVSLSLSLSLSLSCLKWHLCRRLQCRLLISQPDLKPFAPNRAWPEHNSMLWLYGLPFFMHKLAPNLVSYILNKRRFFLPVAHGVSIILALLLFRTSPCVSFFQVKTTQ